MANFNVTFEEQSGGLLAQVLTSVIADYFTAHPSDRISQEELAAAVNGYLTEHPISGVDASEVNSIISDYMTAHPVSTLSQSDVQNIVQQYVSSLNLTSGADGKSAYEIAVENGFNGTQAEWLLSLKGTKGDTGAAGATGETGADGKSAYAIAVDNGFEGTEQEWLESLQGGNAEIEDITESVDNVLKEIKGFDTVYGYTPVQFTTTLGYFKIESGKPKISNVSSLEYARIPVNEGEKYHIRAIAYSYAIAYAFLDENDNAIDWYPKSVSTAEREYIDVVVTTPVNAATLMLCGSSMSPYYTPIVAEIVAESGVEVHNAVEDINGVEKKDTATVIGLENTINAYVGKNTGAMADDSTSQTAIIDVKYGEKYHISGNRRYQTGIYRFDDAQGNIISWYPHANATADAEQYDMDVDVPAGAVKMYVSTYSFRTYPLIVKKYIENYRVIPYGNVLYGKKWAVCGDSFTHGDFSAYTDSNGNSGQNSDAYDTEKQQYKTYDWWIANRNNMVTQRLAVSGNDFTNIEGAVRPFSNPETATYNYTQIASDADYITLMFGLNESNLTDAQIGTKTDNDNTTLWGAYNVVLEAILTANPLAKIGIIISDAWLSANYRAALIAIAKYWGIPYLDLRNGEQVPMMIGGRIDEVSPTAKALRDAAFKVSENNGHPNLKAHEYRSTVIENFLRTL